MTTSIHVYTLRSGWVGSLYIIKIPDLFSKAGKSGMENSSRGQNYLVKCLLTKFVFTKNPVLNTSLVTLKSSLQSEIIYLSTIYPSSLMSVTGHTKQVCIHTCVCVLSRFSCVRLCDPMGYIARQAPLSIGFSRQEYWSGLPCPPPGDLPHPGIKPVSLYVSCIGKHVLYH